MKSSASVTPGKFRVLHCYTGPAVQHGTAPDAPLDSDGPGHGQDTFLLKDRLANSLQFMEQQT